MRRLSLLIVALLLAGGWAPVASAQIGIGPLIEGPERTRPDLPPPPDETVERDPLGRLLPRIEIPPDDPEASALAGGTIEVRAFEFSGNSAFSDEELASITDPYIGEGRRYSALLEARDRITRAYIDAGYISSGAVLPAQSLAEGVVEIEIVEGRVTEVDVSDSGRLRERYVASRLIGSGEALNIDDLRQRLYWLKRDPRIDGVTAELVPGETRGESELSVVVDEARPWWVAAQADNSTPPAIGSYGGLFQVGHRNLTGWGDSLTIGYRVTEGLHDVEARFEVPVTRWETTVELNGRYAEAEVIETKFLRDLEIDSETTVLGFRVRQPVLRSNSYEVRVFAGAERKTGRSSSGGDLLRGLAQGFGKSRVTAIRLGGEAWWRGRSRAFAGRATFSFGIDVFGATNPTQTSSMPFSQPNEEFSAGLFQLQGVEYLPWYGIRVHTRLDFQLADGPLLGLEQMAAGGEGSVRGFRKNLLVRDQGVATSLEFRFPLPTIGPVERFELGVYTDFAHMRNRGGERLADFKNERLLSAGIGFHADVTPYVKASIQYAYAILDPDGDPGDDLQDDGFHFSLRVFFP
jgi:hemolysin activation/secretion protein